MWIYASLTVFFAALMLGVLLGTLTGLIPGFHPNNVAIILVSISPVLMRELHFLAPSDFSLIVASAILATAVTHTFLSFIPVIFMYSLMFFSLRVNSGETENFIWAVNKNKIREAIHEI